MKRPAEMTLDEALGEFQHLDSFFVGCRDAQHGISTKETVRFNLVADRLVELGHGNAFSVYHQSSAFGHCVRWAKAIAAAKKLSV